MTKDIRHKHYGHTIEQEISWFPGELPIDAVGLWQIVPSGRDSFGLEGADLDDFIRRAILALLAEGAVPVRHVPGSAFEWDQQLQYGQAADEIADAIVREWHNMPDDPLALVGEVWFALARPGHKYVKTD